MGAWIEIVRFRSPRKKRIMSHPIWVRGLKFNKGYIVSKPINVASYMGAWIEIPSLDVKRALYCVASYMGAWIEIMQEKLLILRRRVASYMGAWIEIISILIGNYLLGTSHPIWVRGLKF